MKTQTDFENPDWLPKIGSLLTILTGCVVLLGWVFDLPILKSVVPGLVMMKPNAAICFVLCGASLWLLRKPDLAAGGAKKYAARISAAAAGLIGLVTLAEYVFDWNFGLDTWIFREEVLAETNSFPGRMSPATALCFALLGCSLLLLSAWQKPRLNLLRLSHWLAVIIALISIIALMGYAYQVEALYKFYPFVSVALHTSVAFFVLALGILFARGFQGLTTIFAQDRAGGKLARRIVPPALLAPFIIGWVILKGEHGDYYGSEFGLIMFAALNIIVFLLLLWWAIDTLDRERKFSETNTARLAAIVEFSADAIMTKDLDGTILSWNKGAERMLGYPAEKIIGRNVRVLFPPGLVAEEEEIIGKIRRGESIENYEAVRRKQDGSNVQVSITVSPIRDGGGEIIGASKIAREITAHKRTEQNLRESEENFRALTAATTQAVWESGESGVSEEINEWWSELTGQEFGNKQNWLEMLHPDDREKARTTWATALENQTLFTVEYRVMNKNAEYQHFAVRGVPVFNEHGKFRQWIGTFTDISDRKRAEAALRESENRLQTVIENLSEGLIIADLKGNLILWNRASLKMHDLPPGGDQQQSLKNLVNIFEMQTLDGRVLDFEEWVLPRILRGEKLDGVELRVRRTDRNWERIFRYGGATVKDEKGKDVAFLTISDITAQKLAEESVREAGRFYRQIINHAQDGIVVMDQDLRYAVWNKFMENMTGLAEKDVLGKTPLEVFPYLRETGVFDVIERALAGAAAPPLDIQLYSPANKKSHWIATNHSPHYSSSGKIKGVISAVSDITDRKLYEQEILQLNESLEQKVAARTAELHLVNQELESFSFSVSHDLRAPLRAMDGFSLALLEDYGEQLDATGQNYLQRVRSASRHMAQLIDDLLRLSRVARSEVVKTEVNLSRIAQSIADNLRVAEPRANVSFEIADNVAAHADGRLIQIALENLLSNAYKFTSKKETAKIVFGQQQNGSRTEYFISDNGAGFDMAYADKLFATFQRLHSATDFEGTGIGLATVQRVVRKHGGQVRAEGTVGEGASFYFTL